jgi:hypothetical protein
MAGSLENRGKLRELIDKFKFDGEKIIHALCYIVFVCFQEDSFIWFVLPS